MDENSNRNYSQFPIYNIVVTYDGGKITLSPDNRFAQVSLEGDFSDRVVVSRMVGGEACEIVLNRDEHSDEKFGELLRLMTVTGAYVIEVVQREDPYEN